MKGEVGQIEGDGKGAQILSIILDINLKPTRNESNLTFIFSHYKKVTLIVEFPFSWNLCRFRSESFGKIQCSRFDHPMLKKMSS